jgi:uncharacterized protein YbjQ (UPF0145 family)
MGPLLWFFVVKIAFFHGKPSSVNIQYGTAAAGTANLRADFPVDFVGLKVSIRRTLRVNAVCKGDSMAVNPMVDPSMVTTALELPGFRIVRNFGVVRGIVVRSRSIFGTIGAGLQTLAGGNISLYSDLCEKTREDAFELMMQHAAQHGANAIICARYDANDIQQGVTEVLAYGTAVTVERIS